LFQKKKNQLVEICILYIYIIPWRLFPKMAGTLAIVPNERVNEAVTAIREQWEIQFARFFSYPTLSSTCPDLVPLTRKVRNRRRQGTWVSSSSSAVLQLANDLSSSKAILTVCFRGMNLVSPPFSGVLEASSRSSASYGSYFLFCLVAQKVEEIQILSKPIYLSSSEFN
jgi:hypothetical protein